MQLASRSECAYSLSSWLPASLSSTEHSRFNNGTSFSTIAQTRASSTVGYSWVSWFQKSMILRAFVIASQESTTSAR
jgi:hypothetical protein